MKHIFLFTLCVLLSNVFVHAQVLQKTMAPVSQTAFIENKGQFADQTGRKNSEVKYMLAEGPFHLQLRSNGFSYELFHLNKEPGSFPESGMTGDDDEDIRIEKNYTVSYNRVDIQLKGCRSHPEIIAEENAGTFYNYFTEHVADEGILGVQSFNKITYREIYPGIDLVFKHNPRGGNQSLKYEFIVHPGADPSEIRLEYYGAQNITSGTEKNLKISTSLGYITENELYCYAAESGMQVPASFTVNGSRVTFNVSSLKDQTLVIDPGIVWGTYYGGENSEEWDTETNLTVDKTLNPILAGSTESTTYIATAGAYQTIFAGGSSDIYIAKFHPDGTSVEWATYMGGQNQDAAYGTAIDPANNVVMIGLTRSRKKMGTLGTFQPKLLGSSDVIIVKFNTTGGIIWCSLFGGSDDAEDAENGRAAAIDAAGNIYFVGHVTSSTIATPGVFQTVYAGEGDAFVCKFTPTGQRVWATYLGGIHQDRAHDVALDGLGHVYVMGTCESTTPFGTAGTEQPTKSGGVDIFLSKLDTSGHYIWGTYYGANQEEHGRDVLVDSLGYSYVVGWTNSVDHPELLASPGSYQAVKAPGSVGSVSEDGIIAKYNPDGKRVWGTFYGGGGDDLFYDMVMTPAEDIYVTGWTTSIDSIATPSQYQTTNLGGKDGMLIKLDSGGHRIWGTYIGTQQSERIFEMDRDTAGFLYLAIQVDATSMVASPNAYQTVNNGMDDVFVCKYTEVGCFDFNEPNEDFTSARKIKVSNKENSAGIIGGIAAGGDRDFFTFKASGTKPNIKILLTNVTANYSLRLFDKQKNLIAETFSDGHPTDTLIWNTTLGASYYLEIGHDSTQFDGLNCYRLVVVGSATPFRHEFSGDNPVTAKQELFVAPNPAADLLKVKPAVVQQGTATITLFDLFHRAVISKTIAVSEGGGYEELSLPVLPNGTYILEWRQDNMIMHEPVMIIR